MKKSIKKTYNKLKEEKKSMEEDKWKGKKRIGR